MNDPQRRATGRVGGCALGALIFGTLVLGACGGAGPAADTAPLAPAALPDDAQILSKVYAAAPTVPEGFYRDSTATLAMPFTLYHVKSTDLDPAATSQHELCSDDFASAMAWSDQANATRARGGTLLSATETDRYFEFVRTLDGLADWAGYERVFKCAYVDRRAADLRRVDGPAGRINQTPLTAGQLKILGEYLWHFSGHNNPGHAVLASVAQARGDELIHTLTQAALARGAGMDGCDRVTVSDSVLTLQVGSGDLHVAKTTVLTMDSRLDGGQPYRCDR